jgi:WS/DGAT/MGAT family acyltransferase
VFNTGISPLRHLAATKRSLDDLRSIRRTFGTTVNDVVLAVTAGALRRFLERRGESPGRLKAMVPVSVRVDGEDLGNRISFMFVALPLEEPDPVQRLRQVHLATSERKDAGEPEGADSALKSFAYAPRAIQRVLSHAVASPRMFNLVVSNIPGPSEPLYMMGCKLEEAYPVVPLADGHALAVGVTTICDQACFGLYADRRALPDADLLAEDLDAAVEELLELSVRPVAREAEPVPAG